MLKDNERRRMIAERLRRARLEAGLTQKQAAQLLGVSQSVISMQETGRRRITADEAERMKETYALKTRRKAGSKRKKLPGAEAAEVLLQLASLGGSDLECVADNYIALCSYILMRELYIANPKNTDKLFDMDTPSAVMLKEQMFDELEKIRRFASYSKRVKTSEIVPGQVLEARMKSVISDCEALISGGKKRKGKP
ncbi:MAG: helix-turn-helix transcriptional regulator [Ruminococcus sp.]|nr:helix-turn-helix transcriptional regulator [Ruminococcus sp.]